MRFRGARRIPEERKGEENREEKAVATLSLSVQVPASDVRTCDICQRVKADTHLP